MIKKSVQILSLIVSLLMWGASADAAFFRVDSDSGAALRAGDSFSLKVYVTPGEGEKIDGAKCTLNVDPEFIEISPSRSDYSADPSFKLVETFKTDPEQGMVSFRARTAESVGDEKLFLVIPATLKKEGSTFVNLTSSTLIGDDRWAPSTPGYFKIMGVGDENIDPLLAATLESENSLLSAGSFYHSYKIKPQGDSSISTMQFDMGMTALEQANDETTADIVVKFSKESARIGLGKYVRLDLIIDKYPEEAPVFTGIDVRIKFDPSVLQFANSLGQPANQVEIVKPLEEYPNDKLLNLVNYYELEYSSVDYRGEAKDEYVQRKEMMDLIRSYEGFRDETIFSMPFGADEIDLSGKNIRDNLEKERFVPSAMDANFVDAMTGELHLMLLVNLELERKDIVFPQKVASLIFKTNKPADNTTVEITQALLGQASGKLLVKNAYITVDPRQEACDKTLPASLCKGSFQITGDVAFDMQKKRTHRLTFAGAGVKSTQFTVVEKFALTETWNLHMNGSLENGLKVKGHVNKIPNQPQKLDVGVIGDNGTIRFGEFNTGFNGTKKVNTPSSQISGLEAQYSFSNFTFSALLAEGRSETIRHPFYGNGGKLYTLPNVAILPNTVQIVSDDDGTTKVIPPDEYVVDYAHNEIKFKDIRTSEEKFIATFEKSLFLFSSGNINSFGLAYDSQKDDPKKIKRFKVDSAYTTSAAAKAGQQYVFEEIESLNLGTQKLVTCPKKAPTGDGGYVEDANCWEIKLAHGNIVRGSIEITLKFNGNVYTEGSPSVYMTHRSYDVGKITVDRDDISSDVTISYSYYDPTAIFDKRVVVLNDRMPVEEDVYDMDIPWPPDVLHGSEEIYISKNSDYNISRDDIYIGYKYPGIDPWMDELDDETFSFNSTFEVSSDISTRLTYHFDTQFNDVFPSKLIFDYAFGSEGPDYRYLKMRYKSAPPEFEGSSEFTKQAIGLDMMYQPSKSLRFETQYAFTNSDLSSSVVSAEDLIVVDVVTIDFDTKSSTNEICSYVAAGEGVSKPMLDCELSHKNIKGSVEVAIQFCKTENDDAKSLCIGDETGDYVYENQIYNYTSNLPEHQKIIKTDAGNGTISFIRTVNTDDNGKTQDTTFSSVTNPKVDHRFLSRGDRVYVRYLYSQSVDRLVEGDAITLITNYTGKKLNFTYTKNITDPYFDKSFQGKLLDGTNGNVDSTNIKGTYAFDSKWSANFERDTSITEKLEAGITSSSRNSTFNNYGMRYSNSKAKHLDSFVISRSTRDNFEGEGLGVKQTTILNSTETKGAKLFATVKKGFMNFNTTYQSTNIVDAFEKSKENTSILKTFDTSIKPFSVLSTKMHFERLDSTAADQSRTNSYNAVFTPGKLISLDMNFDRTSKTAKGALEPVLTENNAYVLNIFPFYRVSNFSISLSQEKSPPNNKVNYNTAKEKTKTTLNLGLFKGLVFTPTLTSSLNREASLDDSDVVSYKFVYTPIKNKRKFSLSFSRENTDKVKYSQYLTESQTISYDNQSRQQIDMSVNPSTKSTFSVKYSDSSAENTPANNYNDYTFKYDIRPSTNTTFSSSYYHKNLTKSTQTNYWFKYNYAYTSKLSFSASYKKRNIGDDGVMETTYDFNTSIKLNDTSTLDMSYKQILNDGDGVITTGDPTNFTARLKTSFR